MMKVNRKEVFKKHGKLMHALYQGIELSAGMSAFGWSFTGAGGKAHTMDAWPGRVPCINYVDPDEAELNEHFTDALKKAQKEGLLKLVLIRLPSVLSIWITTSMNLRFASIAGLLGFLRITG